MASRKTADGSTRKERAAAPERRAPRGRTLEAAAGRSSAPRHGAAIAALLLGPDQAVRRLSPAAGRLLGLSADDLGRTLSDLGVRLTDRELPRDAESVLRTSSAVQRDVIVGDGRCYLRRVSLYRGLDERVSGVVVIYADVTALKEAEARLRQLGQETDERIRAGAMQFETEVAAGNRASETLRAGTDFVSTVFETTGALIVVFDRACRVVRVNRAWELASGLRAGEIEGRSLWELQLADADEIEAARRAVEAVFAGRGPLQRQGRWRHRDGSLRLFDWTCAALRDAGGEIEFAVASAVEVTAQHAAEQALRAERDLVESVLQTVPALIAVTDGEGRLVRFNRAFERATGYAAAEAVGREIWDLGLSADEIDVARALVAAVCIDGLPRHGESSLRHRDGGSRRVAWTVAALAAGQRTGGYLLATGVDVTEARAAAARERERLEEVAQMHRLHTAGELAAMLAHELNQPLAAIANYAEAGLRKSATEADELQRGFFAQIAEQALRAGGTIAELRRFLARAPVEVSTVDVNAAARGAHNLTLPYARARGIDVELVLGLQLGLAAGGALAVEHIIVNLVRNAVEAIAAAGMASGVVTVRTAQFDDGGGGLRVSVEDSGPGLSSAEAEKVFGSLYSTKADGLGMGLRISRRLAEAQGGHLWVEPKVPGARFHLDLKPAR